MLRYHSAFGEVWKGVVHGTEVAVKKLLIKDIKNERGIIQDFLREVQMMTYVHPHPIQSMP
jgi:serine/threonine protein kinase